MLILLSKLDCPVTTNVVKLVVPELYRPTLAIKLPPVIFDVNLAVVPVALATNKLATVI